MKGKLDKQMEFRFGDGSDVVEAKPLPPEEFGKEREQATKEKLSKLLFHKSGKQVTVAIQRTRRTMLSLRPNRNAYDLRYILRINPVLLYAPSEIQRVLVEWVRNPQDETCLKILQNYVRENSDKIEVRPRLTFESFFYQGNYYNLKDLRDEVNADHFNNTLEVSICWSRKTKRAGRQRSIRLGSYVPQDHLIRIHPYLDKKFVPDFLIRYIVFHEMLHAKLGIQMGANGRRVIHSKEFKLLEAAYPDYDRAVAWLDNKKNMERLLCG